MASQQSEEDDLAFALAIQASLYDMHPGQPAADFSFTSESSTWRDDCALARAIADSGKKQRDEKTTSSAQEGRQNRQHAILEIHGRPAVTHQLVNNYIDHCRIDCDNCRHAMQMVRLIVTEAKEWCRKNLEITCYADHFSVMFRSGDRQNKFVVQVVAEQIHVSVTDESWRMWFQRKVSECWNIFKKVVIYVVDKASDILTVLGGPQGAIAGAALKAIGW